MISFEIIEDREKIRGYYGQWEQLFISRDYEPSLSVEWTEALLKSHIEGHSISLIVLRDSAEVVGLVPLYRKEIKRSGLSLLTLFPVAEHFNTHSDLLLKDASKDLAEGLLKALFSLNLKWDIFRINRFVEAHPLLSSLKYKLNNSFNYKYEVQRAEPSFFIQFEGSYQDFLKKRTANFRYKLKSVSKQMHTLGEVTFLRNRDFRDFPEAFNIIQSIEESSWKHMNGTGITSSEIQRKFYHELFEGAFNKGRLRFCFLCFNKEPIAYEVGLIKGKRYYGVHGSYAESFKTENPGTILLARFIEDLIEDGIEEYDWFGEPFEWESRWTDKYRWHESILIYNHSPKAKLFSVYNRLRGKIKPDKNSQLVLRDPRDIKPEQG
jgi:CelD/BcsL family acetyltransferase involved in cellulose biosynthesis